MTRSVIVPAGDEHSPTRSRFAPLLAASALALAACSGAEDPRPNVLLITLDTTRADRLGAWGHASAQTPRMDELADQGTRFARAFAHVPLTLPSHASLLTGVLPTGHGVHVNFQGQINTEVPVVTEAFAARGYATAAFIAAWVLNRDFGLERGFDVYDDLSDHATRVDQQAERPGREITQLATQWLERQSDRPFFAWVHYFDAHDPHEPPPGMEGFDDAYDAEVAFLDRQVGELLASLERAGSRERTLVIITGDHGESLGEHDEATHGLLIYDSSMHVPLIMHGPGVPAGTVIDTPVGLVDVAPTIYELMGWPIPALTEGRSLAGALRGEALASDPIYMESEYGLRSFGWAPLRGLVSGNWKYIHAPEAELFDCVADPGELDNRMDRERDQGGRLAQALQRLRANATIRAAGSVELGGAAAQQLSALGYFGGSREDELDEENLKDPKRMTHVFRGTMRAKTLMDAAEHERVVATLEPLLADSPESDEMWGLYGSALFELERYDEAIEALEQSLRTFGENSGRLLKLGDALLKTGDAEGALARYQAAAEADPENGQVHSRLGNLHAQSGRIDLAIVAFETYARLEPNSPNAHTNLANAYCAQGRFDDGVRHLERATCIPAYQGLYRVHALRKNNPAAIALLRRAEANLSEHSPLRTLLAWHLATAPNASDAQTAEALTLAQACVRAAPNLAHSHDALAAAQARRGEFDRAQASAREALRLARTANAPNQAAIEGRLARYQRGESYVE